MLLNVTKICMGTGTLALPFASTVGELLFNAIGPFVIGAWNYYSADCLLRCLEYLPEVGDVVDEVADISGGGG
jgi:amino acid permease